MKNIKTCKEILKNSNIQVYLNDWNRWWSDYIFHFSHVTNIASILNDGKLRSRHQIENSKNPFLNENASLPVINGTDDAFKDYVRFYFRPLTPTQFHNEGVRAKTEITELNAHCPVPIFLLFDTAMLDENTVEFSYESLASHHYVQLFKGPEALSKAPFHHIYHNESTSNLDGQLIRKRRHAEIVVKKECDLRYLRKIVCRNETEAQTLKFLLNQQANLLFQDIICIAGKDFTYNPATLFNNTFLQILSVSLSKKFCKLKFNKHCFNERNLLIEFRNNDKLICHYKKERFVLGNNLELSLDMEEYLKNLSTVIVSIKIDESLVFITKFTSNSI